MYITDRHGMTLAVKVVFNLNTTNQPTFRKKNVPRAQQSERTFWEI